MRSYLYLLIAFSAAAHAAPPARVEIAYEMTRNGMPLADITHRFAHGGGSYQVTETWRGRGLFALRGSIKRSSHGAVTDVGLRPLEYSDERTGRDTERARFDWTAKTVTLQFDSEAKTIPLPPHAHDRLAFFYEFAFNPPRGTEVALDVIDGRGVSDQVYRIEGNERLTLPAGDFDTVRLVRRKESGERAELYLARDRDYLPVRLLVIDKNGTRLDQVATRISGE
jgi:uncharacterized protein DUF3108